MDIIKGRVWKYGDNINTDVIYPGKYLYSISDPKEIAKHALEDLDTRFIKEARTGDIIVAGKNWGCGSSRDQAVICLRENGVSAIVAKSFGRIHYRNCLNDALPAITCAEAVDAIKDGEKIAIDLEAGEISCESGVFKFPSFPEKVMEIFEAGGLIEYTRLILKKCST